MADLRDKALRCIWTEANALRGTVDAIENEWRG